MRDYVCNLLYVCLAPFDYGFEGAMAMFAAGVILLAAAAQCFVLLKKRRSAWLPVLCAAAAMLPSVLLYLAQSRGLSVSFLGGGASDLIVYAAIAAVYSLPGVTAGWLVYLAWNKFHPQNGTGL
nr:hypothetical protein [uncultured Oscillibacter sp.]